MQPSLDSFLSAALRGDAPAWPPSGHDPAEMLGRAEFHGITPLLLGSGVLEHWPPEPAALVRRSALRHAMWELQHRRVLTDLLERLAARGVRGLLIKGTALAYGLYPQAALRTRSDTDLLVRPLDRGQAEHALLEAGYRSGIGMRGDFVSYQASYTRQDPDGAQHAIDLHWKINNSELLSRLFDFEELFQHAQPLPQLAPAARGPGAVHALLLACMHRATHRTHPYRHAGEAHHDPDRLIWLYDLKLLTQSLALAQWDELVELAVRKGLAAICLEALERSGAQLGTTVPTRVLQHLRAPAHEAPSRYLAAGPLYQGWADLLAHRSASDRLQYLREHLAPPADYMRAKYPVGALPWLYLRRGIEGLSRRLLRRANPGR